MASNISSMGNNQGISLKWVVLDIIIVNNFVCTERNNLRTSSITRGSIKYLGLLISLTKVRSKEIEEPLLENKNTTETFGNTNIMKVRTEPVSSRTRTRGQGNKTNIAIRKSDQRMPLP